MAGLKKHFPYGRNSMTTVGSHMGPIDFSTLLINHPLKNAVNEIPSKGKIHPQIAKMG
jgi:hypothetical protein